MGFFYPLRLLCGLAVVLVVLLYLNRRGASTDVSANWLWQRALARRGPWRRFQRPVSVALLCLIVALLCLALAEPYWRSDYAAARTMVVILDNSQSMRATDAAPNRMRAARQQAALLIDDLRLYEQMAVLSAGSATRVACGWSDDRTTLHQAVETISPTDVHDSAANDAPGSIAEAIDLAHWMLAGRPNPQIVVITDGGSAGAQQLGADAQRLANEKNVTIVAPMSDAWQPQAATNYAITRLAVRRIPGVHPRMELLVDVANYSSRAAKLPLKISPAVGEPIAREVALEPGQVATQIIPLAESPLTVSKEGRLTATLDIKDDLAADNEASLTLPLASALRIGLPAQLQNDATAGEAAKTHVAAPEHQDLAAEVLIGEVPAKLPPWPLLVIGPTNDSELWRVTPRSPKPATVLEQEADPALRRVAEALDLKSLVLEELGTLEHRRPPDAVLRSADGRDVATLWKRGHAPVVVINVPLDKSDLARRPSFAQRVNNAVAALSGADSAVTSATASVLGAGESDLHVPQDVHFSKLPLLETAPHDPPGAWLLLAALGLCGVEWVLFQRRVTI